MTELFSHPKGSNIACFCLALAAAFAAIFGIIPEAFAHGVTEGDKGYIQETVGVLPIPFIYLGAKHMMTG